MPGSEWVFPIVETLHVCAFALVFGSIVMVDMRLLGLASRESRVSRLCAEVLPWTWAAWCTAAVFGVIMFVSKAVAYAGNLEFRLKFVLMAAAALNMLVFHFGPFRRVAAWDLGEPALAAKWAGGVSLVLWTGVVFLGRWTGFAMN